MDEVPIEEKPYAMDRAYVRLVEVIAVLRFLRKYWQVLPAPDVILDIITQELANVTTPGAAWKMIAEYRNHMSVKRDDTGK